MLDVIERKWRSFAAELYAARVLKFVAMFAAVFAAAVAEPGSPDSEVAVAAVLATWAINLQAEVARLKPRRGEESRWRLRPLVLGGVGPLVLLDLTHLVVIPAVTLLQLAESLDARIGGLLDLPPSLAACVAFVGGAVQVSLYNPIHPNPYITLLDNALW